MALIRYLTKQHITLNTTRALRISQAPAASSFHTSTLSSAEEQQENNDPFKAKKQFTLSFDEFQNLKRSLRTKQRVAGIPFGFAAISGCSMTMAYLKPDMFDATPESVQLVMGLDPIVFTGLTGCLSGVLGYVFGVNVYKFIWAKFNKETAENLNQRDTDFLNRLGKYRFQGDSKFEDDYYGESIKTLSDYRQWVRTHQKRKETSDKFKVQATEKLA